MDTEIRQWVNIIQPVQPRRDTPRSLTIAAILLLCLVGLQWMATSALIDKLTTVLPATWTASGWPFGYFGHFCQLAVALALISILKPFFPGRFGLILPKGKSYVGIALLSGLVMGPVMLVIDYWPNLLAHQTPPGPYNLNPTNVIAWLAMQGVFVGITEEIPFRSLFLGYMLTRVHGRLHVGRFDVSLAGVFTALIFSLAHATSFWSEPVASAIGQQIYVIGYSVFYEWLFEKSGSIIAPIVAHNAGDCLEWVLCFWLKAIWG